MRQATLLTVSSSVTGGGAAGVGTQLLASNSYVQSRGTNLVSNGSGLLGNNYNFSGFTFDPVETYSGGGSFLVNIAQGSRLSDELMPVDPGRTYSLTGWGKSGDVGGGNYTAANSQYFGVAAYDIDGNAIFPDDYLKFAGSTDTTLAAPLNPGDTTVTLTSAARWENAGAAHQRDFVWYGYTNSKGYTYPDYTYTRNLANAKVSGGTTNGVWAAGGITGNVITLTNVWAGPALAAGLPSETTNPAAPTSTSQSLEEQSRHLDTIFGSDRHA